MPQWSYLLILFIYLFNLLILNVGPLRSEKWHSQESVPRAGWDPSGLESTPLVPTSFSGRPGPKSLPHQPRNLETWAPGQLCLSTYLGDFWWFGGECLPPTCLLWFVSTSRAWLGRASASSWYALGDHLFFPKRWLQSPQQFPALKCRWRNQGR